MKIHQQISLAISIVALLSSCAKKNDFVQTTGSPATVTATTSSGACTSEFVNRYQEVERRGLEASHCLEDHRRAFAEKRAFADQHRRACHEFFVAYSTTSCTDRGDRERKKWHSENLRADCDRSEKFLHSPEPEHEHEHEFERPIHHR